MEDELRPIGPSDGEIGEALRCDVLVVGGGVAGFSAAIAAGAAGAEVVCVTKEGAYASSTWWAQGGVAAVFGEDDSFESHRDDTLATGAGLCDPAAVEVVVREGPDRVRELMTWGGAFDRAADASLHLGLEGGHSHRRVIHAHGDRTGMEVQETLYRRARATPGVTIHEHGFAIDLVVEDGVCRGAIVRMKGEDVRIRARAVVLATGGAGQLWRETTNPPIATGDGFAMALRAGAALRDMEFVQFHPTTLYVAGSARHLITEAVRGEGGHLRDRRGERFMTRHHPDGELAPRDVVSRAIVSHMRETGDGHVFLDLTHLDPGEVRARFPGLVALCRTYNLDVTRDRVPVHPSAHYVMGGVTCDLGGRSTLPGLYACGEVASSGLHGANRLASNSLLEGLVFGRRAGLEAAAERAPARGARRERTRKAGGFTLEGSVVHVPDMMNSIKSLMWRNVGIVRDEAGLAEARDRLSDWAGYVFQCRFRDPAGWELVNVLTCSWAVAASALARRESLGAHHRSDHPGREAGAPRHSTIPEREDEQIDGNRTSFA